MSAFLTKQRRDLGIRDSSIHPPIYSLSPFNQLFGSSSTALESVTIKMQLAAASSLFANINSVHFVKLFLLYIISSVNDLTRLDWMVLVRQALTALSLRFFKL